MGRKHDLLGKRFGTLIAIEEDYHISSSGRKRIGYLCECDRGGREVFASTDLVKGAVKTCKLCRSSYRKTPNSLRQSNKRMYSIWSGMVKRCRDKGNKYYGGKGIEVCDRWEVRKGGSFKNFYEDMGESYFDGASIDRIEGEGDYTPSNCRWVSLDQQKGNRKPYKDGQHKGVTPFGNKYRAEIFHEGKGKVLGVFSRPEEAAYIFNTAAKILKGAAYYFNTVEPCEVKSKYCSQYFHNITCNEYFDGEFYCGRLINSKGLISESVEDLGCGVYYPSRNSVRTDGLDLRAVCRCLNDDSRTHKGYKFCSIC